MTPTWTSDCGTVKLWLADCLDVLPVSVAADCVLADIPYGETNNRYESKQQDGPLRKVNRGDADECTFTIENIVALVVPVSKGAIYVWCGTEQVSALRKSLSERTGNVTRLCIWEKTNPSPMNGDKFWLSSLECCVFCHMPNAYFDASCTSPVWRGPVERNQVHPTQKPLWLFERLVKTSAPEGGVVLDFCMGSGTTGVACVRTGRSFLGIEKEPKYFEIAKRRILDELTRKTGEYHKQPDKYPLLARDQ